MVYSLTCGSAVFKQPPGFKELRERVNKFAGDGKENFEVRLADYCEAVLETMHGQTGLELVGLYGF